MPVVKWKPQAEQELEDILVFIAEQDSRPQTAVKLERELHSKLILYAENPDMGSKHPDLPAGVLSCIFKRWVILYRSSEVGIEVLNVIDSARDFPRLFRGMFRDD